MEADKNRPKIVQDITRKSATRWTNKIKKEKVNTLPCEY
jgi:hypothetical protein